MEHEKPANLPTHPRTSAVLWELCVPYSVRSSSPVGDWLVSGSQSLTFILKLQIPELENSLDMIKFLQKQSGSTKEIEMQYMLSDQVYVKAVVPPTDKVCLWLGANVMLEYTLADALNLLTNNIQSAKKNLNYVEHDLDFLR
uniref:Prefoldin subunit 3 n=1 Tax=Timema douglasi TaxID=61478 RepID=A0A7R8Z4K8_TIMDO|nr:unnamed protein product [Timema douglasi]